MSDFMTATEKKIVRKETAEKKVGEIDFSNQLYQPEQDISLDQNLTEKKLALQQHSDR